MPETNKNKTGDILGRTMSQYPMEDEVNTRDNGFLLDTAYKNATGVDRVKSHDTYGFIKSDVSDEIKRNWTSYLQRFGEGNSQAAQNRIIEIQAKKSGLSPSDFMFDRQGNLLVRSMEPSGKVFQSSYGDWYKSGSGPTPVNVGGHRVPPTNDPMLGNRDGKFQKGGSIQGMRKCLKGGKLLLR